MDRMVVVGAVVVQDSHVLAAQRSRPEGTAGRWEFPGGKVEPGETEQQALVRELVEELGVAIEVGEPIDGEWNLGGGKVLRLYLARLLAGEPTPHDDHLDVRWVTPEDCESLDWLDSDREALPAVVRALHQTP